MTADRCSKCIPITSEFTLSDVFHERRINHHDSVAALDESASHGCDMCILLRQRLLYSFTDLSLFDREYFGQTSPLHIMRIRNSMYLQKPGSFSIPIFHQSRLNLLPGSESRAVKRFASHNVQQELQLLVNDMIRPWLDGCLGGPIHKEKPTHLYCNATDERTQTFSSTYVPPLPSRIIDVGTIGEEIRLYITALEEQTHGWYLALSYCWGTGNASARTTKRNLELRRDKIDTSMLPRTILDAIHLTRTLKERFLWVDAICIIQPESEDGADRADWVREAPLMRQYYEGALCTIAAVGASDSGEGFLTERPAQRYFLKTCTLSPWKDLNQPHQPPKTVKLYPAQPSWWEAIYRSPLYKRGWALQERALSRRILYWARDALFWECSELVAAEYAPKGLNSSDGSPGSPHLLNAGESHMKLGRLLQYSKEAILGREWFELITTYSRMHFSFESNRLVALMGIVLRLQTYFEDEYVAGLWRSQLIPGLCWHADTAESFQLKSVNVPSWSWASVSFPISFFSLERCIAEVDSVQKDSDARYLENSNTRRRLRVRSTMQKITFDVQRTNFLELPAEVILQFESDHQRVNFDLPALVPESLYDLDCLLIGVGKWFDDPPENSLAYLVLEATGERRLEYRRIGFATVRESWNPILPETEAILVDIV